MILTFVHVLHTASGPVRNLMANIVIAAPFNITISWTAPEEPNGDITHYVYTVNDTATGALIIGGTTTGTSIVDLPLTNVVPFTNYTVSVLAVNSAGNGEDSTITTVSPETGKVVPYLCLQCPHILCA